MFKRILASLPGIGAALLPNATCPACWPIYGGLLSSVGLGFIMTGPYFYLFIGALLLLSLFSLAYKAQSRRGYQPFWIGLLGAIIIMGGKYFLLPDYVFYTGAFILIVASVWNNIPPKHRNISGKEEPVADCPNCKAS